MANSYGLKRKGVDLSQGPPKRKRDVVPIPAVIETPLVPAENAPSSSGWHSNVIWYQSLWDGPVALVAYSFGGLVLKSLVVEARKHVNQRPKNYLDDEVHKCCKTFLNNVKGVH
ncbi:unnamed protein product [Sphagnum jensenii]|uniref:Uncharacterized protein n=1 Tax=Sphagnum jensenii TaxID=128206 RepID=A0ABP1A7J2_9BRYO